MVREKQGKPSAVLLPAMKAARKEKGKSKGEGKDVGKLKPPPRLGLGLAATTTGPSPAKRSPRMSPEGAPLLKNPRIDQRMVVQKASEAEKARIKELLAGRKNGKPVEEKGLESSKEEEVEEPTSRRTSKDLVAKKKMSGKAMVRKDRKGGKGGVPSATGLSKKVLQKVPSRENYGQKYVGRGGSVAASTLGLQLGLGYYTTDAQDWVFDQYGRRVFRDDEEQMVEESSDDNGDGKEQQQEGDSDEVPLAELIRWEGKAAAEATKGMTEEEEVPEEELESLNQKHKAEMEQRQKEEKAQNLKLAQKCREQVGKIKASGSRGGIAPMSTSSIKASQKLRAQKKVTQKQQQQGGGQKKPHRYRVGTRALIEISKYQKSVEFLIRKVLFKRVV